MIKSTNRRRFLKGSLGALPVAGLTACSETPANGPVIRVGVESRVTMLDPRRATDALSSRINRLIYRQLTDFNASFEPMPDLAKWQAVTPTHYRFTLLEHPRFHHGKTLDALDVVATYQSLLDPSFASPHRGSLKHIERIEARDASTVDFFLNRPDSLFPGRLLIGILPADLLAQNHSFRQKPIGCGACQFVSLTEQKLVLSRPDKTQLAFIPVKDATTRVLKLRKGELDILQNNLSPELLRYCNEREDLRVTSHQGTNFSYIGFNFEDPLLAHPLMREAIAHAIDRKKIIHYLFSDKARLAGGLLVPEHWCGDAKLQGFSYDASLAKAKIAELKKIPGLVDSYLNENGEIELTYKTSSDPTRVRLATIYQSQLKAIGIQLRVMSYDWGTFYNDIKQGRFQLYSLAWVGIKSPDIFQYVFDSRAVPPKGANRGRYRDSRTDELIKLGNEVDNQDLQAHYYRQLQARLQATLAVVPLWYEDNYAVMRANLQSFKMYADGRLDGLITVKKL